MLKGIDLSVGEGEYVLVCGANGSGKSTLGYLFDGLIPHFFGGIVEGSASVAGLPTKDTHPADLVSHVGLVIQNTDAQLFNSTVEDELAFGLEGLGLAPEEISRRIEDTAARFKLEHLRARSPMALSGGERKLAAVASVLCVEPSAVVLDEPYAHLDWEGVRLLRDVLGRIHRSGKTVVVIEQILDGFMEDATRCVVVGEGTILFDGPAAEGRELVRARHLVPRYTRPSVSDPPDTGPVLLSVRGLGARREGRRILNGVSFELRQGETVALVGANGSGKTTLIKHFNGLLRPSEGEVFFRGEPVGNAPPASMAPHVGLSFQNPNDQFFKDTVKEELLVGPALTGAQDTVWFEDMCRMFRLHDLWDRSPYRLSEGEKKRVALCSVLAMEPALLVLDEPTVGQDGVFRETLATLLGRVRERGVTTLLVTHDLDFARAVASRWLLLDRGTIVADGPPERITTELRFTGTPQRCAAPVRNGDAHGGL